MEKRNFTNSTRNGGKTAEMRNNSAKRGMVGMSAKMLSTIMQWGTLTSEEWSTNQHLSDNTPSGPHINRRRDVIHSQQ